MHLADLIPREVRSPGLSAVELVLVQEQAGAVFPDDLCELLMTTLPVGERFPDWRGRPGEVMREWCERLVDQIYFDVAENAFWLAEWGPLPGDAREARRIVEDALAAAPALVPIYGHRAIPNEPLSAGNPVFSVWQTDVIIYGSDLGEYLTNEFARGDTISPGGRRIRFWSHLLDRNNAAP
jgi:hypothetical protein